MCLGVKCGEWPNINEAAAAMVQLHSRLVGRYQAGKAVAQNTRHLALMIYSVQARAKKQPGGSIKAVVWC